MPEAVIVSTARSAIGRAMKGSLVECRPDDLSAHIVKAALDKVITDLQADPKAVFFEIEGHTDNRGAPKYNEQLGMKRAEAVKRYLYETHQVPLHKINVISYGEDKPVADNKTKEGRAENRRIVVRMLS